MYNFYRLHWLETDRNSGPQLLEKRLRWIDQEQIQNRPAWGVLGQVSQRMILYLFSCSCIDNLSKWKVNTQKYTEILNNEASLLGLYLLFSWKILALVCVPKGCLPSCYRWLFGLVIDCMVNLVILIRLDNNEYVPNKFTSITSLICLS